MKAVWARVMILSMIVMASTAIFVSAASTNASAASVDGKWVSRISGEGYTQTYLYFGGSTITESFDTELDLSVSGNSVTGTWTVYQSSGATTVDVDGTINGDTFVMTAHFSWYYADTSDGVYTLTVNGDLMSGTGSYLNVGVTIYGTFDLKKEGLFSVGGMAPVVSGVSISISIVAIVIAATAGAAPKTGFKPQTTYVPSPPSPYQPSQQWTTEVPQQPMSGDGTTPVGGAGLQLPTPAPAGKPFAPRDHFTKVSQEPPRCPVHNGVALTPHYFRTDGTDPGSWYCPMCKNYPWGKN